MTSEIDKLKHFRTTKNGEAVVFENGGFVGNLGLSKKNYGRNILKLVINIELIQVKLLLVIILIYLVI